MSPQRPEYQAQIKLAPTLHENNSLGLHSELLARPGISACGVTPTHDLSEVVSETMQADMLENDDFDWLADLRANNDNVEMIFPAILYAY